MVVNDFLNILGMDSPDCEYIAIGVCTIGILICGYTLIYSHQYQFVISRELEIILYGVSLGALYSAAASVWELKKRWHLFTSMN